MRRLLLILMIALFAVGLTACGSSEPAPEPAVEEAAPAEEAAVEEEVAEEAPADAAAEDGDAAAEGDDDAAAEGDDAAAEGDDDAAEGDDAAAEGDDDAAEGDDAAAEGDDAAAAEGDDDDAAAEGDDDAAEGDDDAAAEGDDDAAEGDNAIYTVDTTASTVGWYGAKAVGSSHTGVVDIAEGQLSVAGDQLVEGSFTMDMTTIHTDDSARLLGHLKSDDFFGIETYPTASLVLKSAEPTDTEGQYEVVADLTIKENTEEITFMADVTVDEGSMTANADIVFDRSLFDVRYGSGSFFDNLGDDLINDEVELTVEIVANS